MADGDLVVAEQDLATVAVDQSAQCMLRTDQVALESVAAAGGGVFAAERLEPPVDLGL